jgi:hypothetical protein
VRLQIAIPEEQVTAPVLNSALEAVTRLDHRLVTEGSAPTFLHGVERRGIRWKPEPPGAERFDHAKTVMHRGHGDCDDLAPWHAGSLRATGEDPQARAVAVRTSPSRWHALVKRGNGKLEDPSRTAGMQAPEGAAPAVTSPMFRGKGAQVVGDYGFQRRAAFACRPVPGPRGAVVGWEARCDVPWSGSDYALTALHRAPVAAQALVGAIMGGCIVGDSAGFISHEDHALFLALCAVLEGAPPEQIARELRATCPEAYTRLASMLPMLTKAFAQAKARVAGNLRLQIQHDGNGRPLMHRAPPLVAASPGRAAVVRF